MDLLSNMLYYCYYMYMYYCLLVKHDFTVIYVYNYLDYIIIAH